MVKIFFFGRINFEIVFEIQCGAFEHMSIFEGRKPIAFFTEQTPYLLLEFLLNATLTTISRQLPEFGGRVIVTYCDYGTSDKSRNIL